MKKLHLFLFLVSMLFIGTSCNNDGPDPDMIWDFTNYNIEFNLSQEVLRDSAFLSKIKISYNDIVYTYSKKESEDYRYFAGQNRTRATYCYPLALRCYNKSNENKDSDKILGFGEFRPDDNYKNQKLTIDWGNGRIDQVEFDIYI